VGTVNLREGVGLALERSTFHFHPPRSDPALISYFRLRSTTGLEAKSAFSVVHSSVNAFRKINRLQRFLHRFLRPSPVTSRKDLVYTTASAVIDTTQLPLFLRFIPRHPPHAPQCRPRIYGPLWWYATQNKLPPAPWWKFKNLSEYSWGVARMLSWITV